MPTTPDAALKAVRRTPSGSTSAPEKPTHTPTRRWGVVKSARAGAVQNSTPAQGSTATVPECANPGIAVGFE